MKKQVLTLAVCACLANAVNANENQVGNIRNGAKVSCSITEKARGCNECFASRTLRYGYTYELFYDYHNTGDSTHFIDGISYTFSRGVMVNNKGMSNKMEYSDWIADRNYFIKSGEKGLMASIKDFSIDRIPSEGTKPNNTIIDYITEYQKVENGKPTGRNISFKTCQPYTISWCGDGVLDKQYDEQCDPKDPKKQGWGVGGCDERTCTPIGKTDIISQLFPNRSSGYGRHQISLIYFLNHKS